MGFMGKATKTLEQCQGKWREGGEVYPKENESLESRRKPGGGGAHL